ncbi:hypothetical protein HDV05_006082 [Chytridiales sp. JEL 0842]|nr:hypothetical protein HDV05_006082 [Chytridiales sp. JEL 0842]
MIKHATTWTVISLAISTLLTQVSAHGMMLCPKPRFKVGMDNSDHQRNPTVLRAPLFPPGTPMLPCGGVTKGQSSVPATSVTPGQDLHVSWEMGHWTGAALHEGTVEISISIGGDDADPWISLGEISLVGLKSVETTPHGMTVKLPADIPKDSLATLRWNWTASVTPEIFYNCADLVFSGGNGDCTSSTNAPSINYIAPTSAPLPNSPIPDKAGSAYVPPSSTVEEKSCTAGSIKCFGKKLGRCDHGQWVKFDCAPGTACMKSKVDGVARCDHIQKDDKGEQCEGDSFNAPSLATTNPGQYEVTKEDEKVDTTVYAVPCKTVKTVTVTTTVNSACTVAPALRKKRADIEMEL